MLINQFIPREGGLYDYVNIVSNVSASHEKRLANPIGTLFATLQIESSTNTSKKHFYRVLSDEIYTLTGPYKDAPPSIQLAYDEFLKGKTPKLPGLSSVFTPTSTPKAKSLVDSLLRLHPCPTPEDHGFYVEPIIWQRLIFNYQTNEPSLLTGPDGTGKSELAELVAKSFKQPTKTFNMGAMLDPTASLTGVHRHQTGKDGSFFDRADFSYAIEGANTIILEELSRAPSSANNILFPVLDNSKQLRLDTATGEDERIIHVHKECRFLATANEGFQYSGTTALDPAMKRRFRIIQTQYMPEQEEIRILTLRTRAAKQDCETIMKVASQLRAHFLNNEITVSANTSATLDAAKLVYGGFDMTTALELAFLHLYKEVSDREKVLDVLQAR